jgi:hypothetical protein
LDFEALASRVPGELEVVGEVAGYESDAREGLDAHWHDADDCATEVGFAETFSVSDAFSFSLDFFERDLYEGETLLAAFAGVAELVESFEGFVILAFGDEPPWRSR